MSELIFGGNMFIDKDAEDECIEELEHELAIYKKALELACEELEDNFGHYEPFYMKYYLQQAKEELN